MDNKDLAQRINNHDRFLDSQRKNSFFAIVSSGATADEKRDAYTLTRYLFDRIEFERKEIYLKRSEIPDDLFNLRSSPTDPLWYMKSSATISESLRKIVYVSKQIKKGNYRRRGFDFNDIHVN